MPTQVSADVVIPRNTRVLVTSRHQTMREHLRGLLEQSHSVRVRDAYDARTSAAEIADGKYDVAVVDHDLWCTRLEPAARIRRSMLPTPGTSIVIIGGDCGEAGCQPASDGSILIAPGDADVLVSVIEEATRAAKSRRRRETMMRWLEREATTDPLTGLHKRDVFDDELRSACSTSTTPVGLVLVRVVGIGAVNYNYGREAADRMIRQAGAGFSRMVRGNDCAARISTDTFGVVIRDADIDVCRRVARRISRELERANSAEWQNEIPVSVVLGVACGTGCSSRELFEMARAQIGEQREPIPAFAIARRSSGDGPSVA